MKNFVLGQTIHVGTNQILPIAIARFELPSTNGTAQLALDADERAVFVMEVLNDGPRLVFVSSGKPVRPYDETTPAPKVRAVQMAETTDVTSRIIPLYGKEDAPRRDMIRVGTGDYTVMTCVKADVSAVLPSGHATSFWGRGYGEGHTVSIVVGEILKSAVYNARRPAFLALFSWDPGDAEEIVANGGMIHTGFWGEHLSDSTVVR